MTDITMSAEEMVDLANASLERNREMKARIAELEAEVERLLAKPLIAADANELELAILREYQKVSDSEAELADKRIAELEAENERLREIIAVNVDPTGMDQPDHDLVMECVLAEKDDATRD